MRRGSCGGIGTGQGGYNKPPPTPVPHGNPQAPRVRVHSMDSGNGSTPKVYGTQTERSPSFGGSLAHSPSHFGGRENSPNSSFEDLHDCSMCLLAYIQSLNTVCGTACRLAQCLSQVATDSCPDGCKARPQWPHVARESADLWEGIARAVGLASANAKTQVIAILQEIQIRQNDYSDITRRQEISKIVHAMLQMFLNLHCQFSWTVLERFSNVLHYLRDDVTSCTSPFPAYAGRDNGHANASPPSNGQNIPAFFFQQKPPPTLNSHANVMPHVSASFTNQQHQLLLQQQKQQLMQQQQLSFHQHILQLAQQQQKSPSAEPLKEESLYGSSHPSSTSGSPWSNNAGSPLSASSSSPNVNANQSRNNSLSPGLLTAGGIPTSCNEWNADATLRRWSMGGTADGWSDKVNCLAPFTFANRRWSVPETYDDPHSNSFGSGQLYNCHEAGHKISKGFRHHSLGGQGASVRSPSHSRSVTPVNRSGSLPSDELQSVVDLLSLPMLSEEPRPSSNASSIASPNCSFANDNSDDKHKGDLKMASKPTNSSTCSAESSGCEPSNNVIDDEAIGKERTVIWTERRLSQDQAGKCSEEGKSQISTPLWPPTKSVPGVTLTECSGEEENPVIQGWNDSSNMDPGGNFSRDSPNRASWPATSINRFGSNGTWDLPEEAMGTSGDSSGGWPSCSTPSFRRHSTDAPYLLPQSQNLLGNKTRSFENLTKTDLDSSRNSFDSNIQNLLYMGSLLPNASTADSHYNLFTHNN